MQVQAPVFKNQPRLPTPLGEDCLLPQVQGKQLKHVSECIHTEFDPPDCNLGCTVQSDGAGSFLYTAPFFTQLRLTSRLSAVALVESLLEHNLDDESYLSYDSISAKQLFSAVSPDLYRRGPPLQLQMSALLSSHTHTIQLAKTYLILGLLQGVVWQIAHTISIFNALLK